MNKYEVYFTWTEPSMDCPFVVCSKTMCILADGLSELQEDIDFQERMCLNANDFSFRATNITLLEEGIGKLLPKVDEEGKYIEGYATKIKKERFNYILITECVDDLSTITGYPLDSELIFKGKFRGDREQPDGVGIRKGDIK